MASKRKASSTSTPRQYAIAVDAYSLRSKEDHLYSGSQFKQLARLLSHGAASAPLPRHHFQHVIVHSISSKERKQDGFDGSKDVARFLTSPGPSPGTSQIGFLRGFSSHEWLNAIGAKNHVDPEFLRRHLDFIQTTDFYDLPPLPSSTRNFIQLKLINICVQSVPLSLEQLREAREAERTSVKELQSNSTLQDSCGNSIVRRISAHSRTLYTLEQQVSCCVKKQNGSWAAVVWLDAGLSKYRNSSDLFVQQDAGLNPFKRINSAKDVCHPVIQHQSKVTFGVKEIREKSPQVRDAAQPPPKSFEPSANLLPSQYGSSLDSTIMTQDPLYALKELFEFSACSHNQFLNMMETLITEDIDSFAEHSDISFANLAHHKLLLDEHIKYLPTTISSLRKRGGSKWPRATESPAKEVVDDFLHDIIEDFEHLLEVTQRLSARCVEGTSLIINTAMLQESKKAITQAEQLSGLTKLAALFVPTSFVCSFFGMNVVEFGQGALKIWVVFAVLGPALVASILLCFMSSVIALFKACISWI